MKPSKKRSKKSVQLLFILSLLFTGIASAQTEAETATQTTVLIEGGASIIASKALREKTEWILQAINGTKEFPNESGVAQLKSIIKEKQLVSTLDTLGTLVIKSGKTFELPRIILQKKGGKAWETTNLIFQFDSKYALTGVRQSNVKRNIDRILSRQIAVDAEEQAQIDALIKRYIKAFESKQIDQLTELFAKDATIIVGTKSRNFDGFEIVSSEVQGYLGRVDKSTFVAGNKISLSFENPRYYRHPDVERVFGFTALQNWTTTSYSDKGYFFAVLDLSNTNAPKIELRQWQENDFVASRFSDNSPDPWFSDATVTGVEAKAEKTVNGVIHLSLETSDADYFSLVDVKTQLESGAIQFKGIKVESSELISDNSIIKVNYSFQETKNQELPIVLQVKESGLVYALKKDLKVYPDRITTIGLVVSETKEKLEEKAPINLFGNIMIQLSPDKVLTQVREAGDSTKTLYSEIAIDSIVKFRLLEGNYNLEFSRNGYITETKELKIKAGVNSTFVVSLAPAATAADTPPAAPAKNPTKVGKAKWWILGAAAVLVSGGAIAYFVYGNNADAGIPIPPGRPVGIN
jgi:hypothetical protein